MTASPTIFDRALHRRRLHRAARTYYRANFLKIRATEDILDRLAVIHRRFPVAVDLGARDGTFSVRLAAHEVARKIDLLVQTDLSMAAPGPGLRLFADEERLPLAGQSCDLIISSLALHWVNDLVGALVQVRLALKPDGLFLGALLGGSTLTELRQCIMQAEIDLVGGAGPRISPFADAIDAAGLLQRAGFALPVTDIDRVVVRYDHPLALMADLRAMGETNVLIDRPRTPLTRPVLARACEIYAQRFSDNGRIRATFEIITLTGWAPHPDQQKPLRPGSAKMRLADALGVTEHTTGDPAAP